MSRVAAVLLLAIGARAFGPHGDTTTKYEDVGWCRSGLDFDISEEIESLIETPELCFELCLAKYGDDLVAIDFYAETTSCYCQDDCECMEDIEGETTITRDSKVDALPDECEDHGGKRMLTAGAPSFEEYRKSHKERKSHK